MSNNKSKSNESSSSTSRRSNVILVPKSSESIRSYFIGLRRYLLFLSLMFTLTSVYCFYKMNTIVLWLRLYSSAQQWQQRTPSSERQLVQLVFTLIPIHSFLTFLFIFALFAWPNLFMALGQTVALAALVWMQSNHYPQLRVSRTVQVIGLTVNLLHYLYSFMIIRHKFTKQTLFKKKSKTN